MRSRLRCLLLEEQMRVGDVLNAPQPQIVLNASSLTSATEIYSLKPYSAPTGPQMFQEWNVLAGGGGKTYLEQSNIHLSPASRQLH